MMLFRYPHWDSSTEHRLVFFQVGPEASSAESEGQDTENPEARDPKAIDTPSTDPDKALEHVANRGNAADNLSESEKQRLPAGEQAAENSKDGTGVAAEAGQDAATTAEAITSLGESGEKNVRAPEANTQNETEQNESAETSSEGLPKNMSRAQVNADLRRAREISKEIQDLLEKDPENEQLLSQQEKNEEIITALEEYVTVEDLREIKDLMKPERRFWKDIPNSEALDTHWLGLNGYEIRDGLSKSPTDKDIQAGDMRKLGQFARVMHIAMFAMAGSNVLQTFLKNMNPEERKNLANNLNKQVENLKLDSDVIDFPRIAITDTGRMNCTIAFKQDAALQQFTEKFQALSPDEKRGVTISGNSVAIENANPATVEKVIGIVRDVQNAQAKAVENTNTTEETTTNDKSENVAEAPEQGQQQTPEAQAEEKIASLTQQMQDLNPKIIDLRQAKVDREGRRASGIGRMAFDRETNRIEKELQEAENQKKTLEEERNMIQELLKKGKANS